MASAVTGFMTSFGIDEPMGCYEDIDHANVFITWGNNMAEMHPVLFSRMLANRKRRYQCADYRFCHPDTQEPARLPTNRSFLNPRPIWLLPMPSAMKSSRNGWVNWDFVNEHVSFHKGKTNIGYGTRGSFCLYRSS